MLLTIFLLQSSILETILASNEGKHIERVDHYSEVSSPRGPLLPDACYDRGVNYKGRVEGTRFDRITIDGCFDKCKGRFNVKNKKWICNIIHHFWKN